MDPNTTPALMPPAGMTSNFVNPQSQAYWFITVLTLSLTLTTISILLRFCTRIFVLKPLGWDDLTSFLAWILFIGYAAVQLDNLKNGVGVDQWNITIADATNLGRLSWDEEVIYVFLICITKLSILFMYLRIFNPPQANHGKTYIAIQVTIAFNVLYYTATFFVVIFQCIPRSKVWNPTTPGSCINFYGNIISSAVLNLISDLMVLAIPLAAIWRLQMTPRRKLGVVVVFATALLGVAFTTARLVCSIKDARLVWEGRGGEDLNKSVLFWQIVLWTDAEVATGIIVGCMPIIPPLWHRIFHKTKPLSHTRRSNDGATSIRSPSSSCPLWEKILKMAKEHDSHRNKDSLRNGDFRNGDLELSGRSMGVDSTVGTTSTICCGERGFSDSSSMETVRQNPDALPLVSKTIYVESQFR